MDRPHIDGNFRVVADTRAHVPQPREPALNLEALCVFAAVVAVIALARYAFLVIH